jgi:hypothetical protein
MGGIAGRCRHLIIRAIRGRAGAAVETRLALLQELGVAPVNGFAGRLIIALTTWLWFGT